MINFLRLQLRNAYQKKPVVCHETVEIQVVDSIFWCRRSHSSDRYIHYTAAGIQPHVLSVCQS